jgi:extradiol dioxygenase family protein
MGLERMRLHSPQEFQSWLANDLEVRDELTGFIGQELGLDELSLDVLEAFLLRRYHHPDEALTLNERGVLDAAARHIGLVMLLNVDGSAWSIELEDEDYVYYRLPIIRFSDGAAACPLTLATASLNRRTGEYLRTVVENYEEDYNTASE